MKKHSYNIKHDFLFDDDDTIVDIPQIDSNCNNYTELTISEVMKMKDLDSFNKRVEALGPIIVIKDDMIGCINPASFRYKQFIIRCVYRKLTTKNIKAYV